MSTVDGDRKQDFNKVDPKSGSIILYKNKGQKPNGQWGWEIANNGKPIATGLGPGRNVRLADLDGDGKADYILLGAERGDAIVHLNKGEKPGGWTWIPYNEGKSIATGIGFIADHVQFKDIDGDGLADYLGLSGSANHARNFIVTAVEARLLLGLIDQLSGATTVYRNLGPKPNGGWGWSPMNDGKPITTGIGSVGRDVLWGRLEKTNRYSYVGIAPNTGALRVYLNGCNEFTPAINSSGGPGSPGQGGNTGAAGGAASGSGAPGGADATSDENALGVYVNGGKAIPSVGLGGLGLATTGAAATSASAVYAITSQNTLTTTRNAVDGLRSGKPTSAGVKATIGALTTLTSNYGALSNQAKKWNVDTFAEKVRPGARKAQSDLESARQAVSAVIPKLNACLIRLTKRQQASSSCQPTYDQAAAVLAGPALLTPLSWLGSGGSGSGGRGASAGGGEGGAGAGGGPTILGGGLPFPSGGLSSLGLPRLGAQAITAMKPYAITAYDALISASNLARPLGASSTLSQLSAAGNALEAAGSADLSALAAEMEGIELQSLTGGQPAVVQTELANLRSAAKIVSGLSTKLRGAVNTPGLTAAALVVGTIATEQYVLQSLYFFLTPKNPLSKGAAPPVVISIPGDEPEDWYLNTIPGTSVKAFQAWIKTLPDKGLGRQHIYASSKFQSYVGKWTEEESIIIHQDPMVSHQVRNRPCGIREDFIQSSMSQPYDKSLQKRVDNPIIAQKPNSYRYQKILSLQRRLNIHGVPDHDPLYDYTYEQSAGAGTFIYDFDEYFDWNHPEFQGINHEEIFQPGYRSHPVPSIHGTVVAAFAAGLNLGIVNRATVVGVRRSGDTLCSYEEFDEAWRVAIDHVRNKGRIGKAVFVFPTLQDIPNDRRNNGHHELGYLPPYNIPRPSHADPFVDVLAEAWDYGIPTVFAAGNHAESGSTQGEWHPIRYAKPNNPMIVVGSVDRLGNPSFYSTPAGPPRVPYHGPEDILLTGETTTSAHGDSITAANPHFPGGYNPGLSGTSFTAPMVAGSAAYLLGLPNVRLPANPRQLPMAMKAYIVRTQRVDPQVDGVGIAYNGVWELTCDPVTTISKRKKKRHSVDDMVFLEEKMGARLGLNGTWALNATLVLNTTLSDVAVVQKYSH
ncbi:MAG: hypothetical protein Q9168_003585 [Polycauliona sp. 1 TL-2023]